MPQHQFTTAMPGGQAEDERAKRARQLFRVSVRQEKAACVIHQQFVRLCDHLAFNAQ
jgi:hypothetical protein